MQSLTLNDATCQRLPRVLGRLCRWLPFTLILLGLCSVGADRAWSEAPTDATPSASVEAGVEAMRSWVLDLNAPSYYQRRAAAERLEQAGIAARIVLLEGLESESLETRTSCRRLLGVMVGNEREAELQRLLYGYQAGHAYELPGWERFRRAVGDSTTHRLLFGQVYRRHGNGLRWLDSLTNADQARSEELATIPESLGLDSQRLSGADSVEWAYLLLAASHPQVRNTPTLTSQVYGGLLDPKVSHKILAEGPHSAVLNLIRSWVAAQVDPIPRRSLVQICLRYSLRDQAAALSQRILSQGGAPSATQYALLSLAVIDDSETEGRLRGCLSDMRVCHTWQVGNASRRIVRTEVRDTALALLLHKHGVDPREVGFEDIQADQDTIFRDFSIGFSTPEARIAAHRKAAELLGLPESTVGE